MRHSIHGGVVAAWRAPCYARIWRFRAPAAALRPSLLNVRLLGEAATVHPMFRGGSLFQWQLTNR
jgi:hypothetical protein